MSNVDSWTEGRYRTFITTLVRRGFTRYPPRYEVLKSAFTSKKINKKTGRICSHYKCAKCRKAFPTTEVQVDHINPVVDPVVGFVSWDVYIERLYCTKDNLQVLCLTCHKAKTAIERKKK